MFNSAMSWYHQFILRYLYNLHIDHICFICALTILYTKVSLFFICAHFQFFTFQHFICFVCLFFDDEYYWCMWQRCLVNIILAETENTLVYELLSLVLWHAKPASKLCLKFSFLAILLSSRVQDSHSTLTMICSSSQL